jgi:hypothetical protein
MKLILNKESQGVAEMQKYFSHLPGTIEFPELEADVILAQEEVARYIGDAVLNLAIDHYLCDHFQTETPADMGISPTYEVLDELVYRVQMPVTLIAYRDYAKNNDATHTATGRTARMDKASDEFNRSLIDSDDMALMQKGLKVIDRLIKYIDDQQFEAWTSSVLYRENSELLIWNADMMERYFPIERNRRVFQMLVPMIRNAQLDLIKPRVGNAVYAEMLNKVRSQESGDGSTTDADLVLLDLMCRPIAEMAIAEGYTKLPWQLYPENMVRQLWSAGNGAGVVSMLGKMVQNITTIGLKSLKSLEDELERRAAVVTETPITDDTIVDIADRMYATYMYARV